MQWRLRLQAIGSVFVIGAFALAEISVRMLDSFPGSPLAWYLCVGVFRPFEAARIETSALRFLFGPPALGIACALMLLTIVAYVARRRWFVAAIANLSFVLTAFLAHAWFVAATPVRSASLNGAASGPSADNLVVGAMLLVSLLAASLGHASLLGSRGPAPTPRSG